MNLSVVAGLRPQSSMLTAGVENKPTSGSKLNDNPANIMYTFRGNTNSLNHALTSAISLTSEAKSDINPKFYKESFNYLLIT